MRLVRLVVTGLVVGAVGGFAAALLRPRTVHSGPSPTVPEFDPAPLPEELDALPETVEVRR